MRDYGDMAIFWANFVKAPLLQFSDIRMQAIHFVGFALGDFCMCISQCLQDASIIVLLYIVIDWVWNPLGFEAKTMHSFQVSSI